MKTLSKLIASGFYSGYLPKAPGTWGTLSFIFVWLLLENFSNFNQCAVIVSTIAIGFVSTQICLNSFKHKARNGKIDPSYIVIDEWAGMAISLINVPSTNPELILIAFLLFRVFDVTKIWPIVLFEKLPGSAGIMLDDIVAGIFSALIVNLILL
ncbi:MAG: phosphatidylglycerophosphatase A [Deltaproteobacteria bacterium]|nr:phosphatidylglycerophosphatase A [Deltaproteobacteria bacterium]